MKITFDEPRSDAGSQVSHYAVLIQGQGLEEEVVRCTESPCVISDLTFVTGGDYTVEITPAFAIYCIHEDSSDTATVSFKNCDNASQDLVSAIKAKDDDAALQALECPVDLTASPLKDGFANPIYEDSTQPALMAAVIAGMIPTVERLIAVGADMYEEDSGIFKRNNLVWAAMDDNVEMAKVLIDAGFDVDYFHP